MTAAMKDRSIYGLAFSMLCYVLIIAVNCREGFLSFLKKQAYHIHSFRNNCFTINCKRILVFLFLFFTLDFQSLTLSFAESPNRIISLAPSITEILFAAGLEDNVVGVTTFCDYPEAVKNKQKIGGMSNPSLEAIVLLRPDIVIMSTDVNPGGFEQRLRSMKVRTYVHNAASIAQLPDGIRNMGDALDEKERFDNLASDIQDSLDAFKVKERESGKKVVFMIWPEPLMVAGPGTAVDDVITLLGAKNIAWDTKIQYPKYSIEKIVRRSPDIIFIGKASGMDMQKTSKGLLKKISYIPAVKNNKVFYVSDSLYRLGPRVIKGIEELEGYLE